VRLKVTFAVLNLCNTHNSGNEGQCVSATVGSGRESVCLVPTRVRCYWNAASSSTLRRYLHHRHTHTHTHVRRVNKTDRQPLQQRHAAATNAVAAAATAALIKLHAGALVGGRIVKYTITSPPCHATNPLSDGSGSA